MHGKVLPMNTAFTFSVGLVPSQQELVDLYTSVGWSAYTDHPENLVPMCTGSLYLAVAREDATGRLAGLVRAVGDGVSISYIQDLLINPDSQKSALGLPLTMGSGCFFVDNPHFLGQRGAGHPPVA